MRQSFLLKQQKKIFIWIDLINNYMQPYRNIQQQKGLFTFYREQAQIQDHYFLNNKRKKGSDRSGQNNETCDEERQTKNFTRKQKEAQNFRNFREFNFNKNINELYKQQVIFDKLVQIQEENDPTMIDNNNVKKQKQNFRSQNNSIQRVQLLEQKRSSQKFAPKEVQSVSLFKKYSYEVDELNYKKIKKMYIQQFPKKQYEKHKVIGQIKKVVAEQNNHSTKIQDHSFRKNEYQELFRKLAIEPKQFYNSVIQVSSDLSMIRQHRKEKVGLKSYKKQKKNDSADNQFSLKINFMKAKSIEKSLENQKNKSPSGQQLRHIRTQKNSIKFNGNELDKFIKPNQSHLPAIIKRIKPQTDRGYSIGFQLQRSSQLKNKYNIKKMEQQEHNLRQINHHTKKGSLDMDKTDSNLNIQMHEVYDQHLFSQRRDEQGKIFLNRRNQQKRLLKNIRIPLFQQTNSNQKQIQKQMLAKKKQLLHNLLQNFNFL